MTLPYKKFPARIVKITYEDIYVMAQGEMGADNAANEYAMRSEYLGFVLGTEQTETYVLIGDCVRDVPILPKFCAEANDLNLDHEATYDPRLKDIYTT